MKILFCSLEVFFFSKIGGLVDMVYFLFKFINVLGYEIVVIIFYYEGIKKYYEIMIYFGIKIIYMGYGEVVVNYYKLVYESIIYIFV